MSLSKLITKLKYLAGLILLGATLTVSAVAPEDKLLLKQGYVLHQMWAVARNYAYGTTVSKNPIKAYAFALLYSKALPDNYPGKQQLLSGFSYNLTKDDLALAKKQAKELIAQYRLGFHFDERKLYRLFELQREKLDFNIPKPLSFKSQQDFFDKVKADNADFYEKIVALKSRDQDSPYLFGQLHLEGSEPVNMVEVNQALLISKEGYFFGNAQQEKLVFNFPGYQGYAKDIKLDEEVINLNHVILKKASLKNRANLVGRIAPVSAVNQTDIVLRLVNDKSGRSPYLTPMIPVTRLSDGQFYVKGLAANQYELVVRYKEKKLTKTFTLHAGNYKAIPLISLNKE